MSLSASNWAMVHEAIKKITLREVKLPKDQVSRIDDANGLMEASPEASGLDVTTISHIDGDATIYYSADEPLVVANADDLVNRAGSQ